MDLSDVPTKPLTTTLNPRNIEIKENYGLDGKTGFWLLKFTFNHHLEIGIVVRITNFKHDSLSGTWTLEIEKCDYLGIKDKETLASFDMVDELVNAKEFERLQQCRSTDEKLREYLDTNVVPLIAQKIKYTKYVPQFRFFLSHKTKDKPIMRSFKNGLEFLGYQTWIDESNMGMGAYLKQALKTSVEKCDCLIAWLNEEYFKSDYCKAELLYAKQLGKIIIPFGVLGEIEAHLNGELSFLKGLIIIDPSKMSFFEVLKRIDTTLFNFEEIAFPS